jgi:hypothetical protein
MVTGWQRPAGTKFCLFLAALTFGAGFLLIPEMNPAENL